MSHHGSERAVKAEDVRFRSGVTVSNGVAVNEQIGAHGYRSEAVDINTHHAHESVHLLQHLKNSRRLLNSYTRQHQLSPYRIILLG